MNSQKPPTRFGLETCQDIYTKLKWEARRLEDGWRAYDTFNFVVTASHLYVDWIDNCGSQENRAKKGALPESAKMVMQSVIDLSIGCKHWQAKQVSSLERQVINAPPERCINDWVAYIDGKQNGAMWFFTFCDYRLSMMELRDLVLGYFKWIFEDDVVVFPLALQNQLDTYKITPEGIKQNGEF